MFSATACDVAVEQVWNWSQEGLTPAECLRALGHVSWAPCWRNVHIAVAQVVDGESGYSAGMAA